MRRFLALAIVSAAAAVAPSTASAKPPLPCDYWVHGCNVLEYVCDSRICDIGPAPEPVATKI